MTALIVIRGNTRAGKSTLASALREQLSGPVAVVGQDVVRRQILTPDADVDRYAPVVMDALVRSTLTQGITTIVEGIWFSEHYGATLANLAHDHSGPALFVRLEATLDVSLSRHERSPEAHLFGADDIRSWWREVDPLPGVQEMVLAADLPTAELVGSVEREVVGRP